MSFRYQIEKGAESRTFVNTRRLSETVVESDEPLDNRYLTLIVDQTPPSVPPVNPAQNAPAIPTSPSNIAPNEQTTNKEASK